MRSDSSAHDPVAGAAAQTRVIHAGRELDETSSIAPPIYQTANFRAKDAEDFARRSGRPRHPGFYTRYANPTVARAEAVLASIEGAESALATASGMAAVAASVLTFVSTGDHVIAQKEHYGGTAALLRDFLPRFGVSVTTVDQTRPEEFERAVRPETRLIVVETPSNPLLTLTDLEAVSAIARPRGIVTLVDNTFASPINQRPLAIGIDLAFYSATKYFGGHSDLIAGAVVGSAARLERIWSNHVLLGAALGPFDAWLTLRGLRTLPLRIRAHNANAMALARYLEKHPAVSRVFYPGLESHPQHALARRQMTGFGGMLSFEVAGGYEAADRVLGRFRLVARASSLGGVESLAVHPASNFLHYMTLEESARLGISPGLLRLSVGIEAEEDLIADFEQALRA